MNRRPFRGSTLDRISHYTRRDENTGCLLWTGRRQWGGYGVMTYHGACRYVTRVLWELVNGPIPAGKIICHSCDVRACVNLGHLWLGTHKDNAQDRNAKGRDWQSKRTHCPQGHEYSHENLEKSTVNTFRRCKVCHRIKRRIELGWPEELARAMPVLPVGAKRLLAVRP